jgi:hypothetical protein
MTAPGGKPGAIGEKCYFIFISYGISNFVIRRYDSFPRNESRGISIIISLSLGVITKNVISLYISKFNGRVIFLELPTVADVQ